MNWNLQHALNGGEVKIGRFFVDGYDFKLGIIFKYDEPKHEKPCNKKKDIERQNKIIELCKPNQFWRYSEKYDELYRIF